MARIYETLSGHRIEFADPSPELETFLSKVRTVYENKKKTENDLVALIYSRENPIMGAHPIFADRGYVTREVLENPVYLMLSDLLVRKRVATDGVDPASLGKRFTLDVPTAAEKFGVTPAAIRKAIDEKRLPSWKRNGNYYLDPHTFHALRKGKLAEATKGEPLRFVAGYDPKAKAMLRLRTDPGTFQVPVPGHDGEVVAGIENTGTATEWRRALVLTGQGGSLRAWLLTPSSESNRVEIGKFFVTGKFEITMKANNARAAREAWEAFGTE